MTVVRLSKHIKKYSNCIVVWRQEKFKLKNWRGLKWIQLTRWKKKNYSVIIFDLFFLCTKIRDIVNSTKMELKINLSYISYKQLGQSLVYLRFHSPTMSMIFNDEVEKINFHSQTVWNWNRIIAVHSVWVEAWVSGTFKCIVYHWATTYKRKRCLLVFYSSLTRQGINNLSTARPGWILFQRKR